jgi:transcriptional regulator with XRE-family HTH domain
MNTVGDYEKFIRAIGETIHEKRLASGITQGDLGKLTGRNQSTIAKIENGPLPNVGIKVVFEIASALSLTASELFELAETKSTPENKKKNQAPDSAAKKIQKGLEALPPKKRKWLEGIFIELVRGSQEH